MTSTKKLMMVALMLAATATLAVACGSTSTPDTSGGGVCVPGQTVACACPGGAPGAQSCRDDGSGYDACVCPTGDTGAVDTAAADSVVADTRDADEGRDTAVADTRDAADALASDDGTPSDVGDGTVDSPSTDGDAGPDADTASAVDGDSGDADAGDPCTLAAKTGSLVDFQSASSAKRAASGDVLQLTGVVATSPKFLVSKSSKTGACRYGVFVADANATFATYSGILVVSQGTDAVAGDSGATTCIEGDLIASDVKPGDKLDLKGVFDFFGPTDAVCGGATPPAPLPTPAAAPIISRLCSYTKTGTTTPIAPLAVTPDDIKGTGVSQLQYANGLVKVTSVKAKTSTAPGDSSFGNFTLDPSGLQVGDKIYFHGAATAPVVSVGQTFTEIVGISYLDFCTWSLEPRTICDLKPPPLGGDAGTCP